MVAVSLKKNEQNRLKELVLKMYDEAEQKNDRTLRKLHDKKNRLVKKLEGISRIKWKSAKYRATEAA